jgi:hypothetical protein
MCLNLNRSLARIEPIEFEVCCLVGHKTRGQAVEQFLYRFLVDFDLALSSNLPNVVDFLDSERTLAAELDAFDLYRIKRRGPDRAAAIFGPLDRLAFNVRRLSESSLASRSFL